MNHGILIFGVPVATLNSGKRDVFRAAGQVISVVGRGCLEGRRVWRADGIRLLAAIQRLRAKIILPEKNRWE